ncbi:MAG: four helix bundle protein [Candidatus Acidiferrales bacterium]
MAEAGSAVTVGRGARSFEDLRVFQEARALANRVLLLTRTTRLAKDYALCDQMRRAAVSIVSNIAEGFERETRPEFIRGLYVARGSCGELRAQLLLAFDQQHFPKSEHESLAADCRRVSVGLWRLIQYLRKRSEASLSGDGRSRRTNS